MSTRAPTPIPKGLIKPPPPPPPPPKRIILEDATIGQTIELAIEINKRLHDIIKLLTLSTSED